MFQGSFRPKDHQRTPKDESVLTCFNIFELWTSVSEMPRRKVPIPARPRTTIRPIPEHSGFTSSSSSSSEALASNSLPDVPTPNEPSVPTAPASTKTSLPTVSTPKEVGESHMHVPAPDPPNPPTSQQRVKSACPRLQHRMHRACQPSAQHPLVQACRSFQRRIHPHLASPPTHDPMNSALSPFQQRKTLVSPVLQHRIRRLTDQKLQQPIINTACATLQHRMNLSSPTFQHRMILACPMFLNRTNLNCAAP